MAQTDEPMTIEAAAAILGVDAGAEDPAIRLAYVEQVKRHPPDADPVGFERVRDAYALLGDPHQRAGRFLQVDADAPLVALLGSAGQPLSFVGAQPWLEALAERGSA